ncbi:YraN family protein [Actinosynnema sp. NPDC023658]|uniref:YraN family protein n=1 Tax=Actinosynnema sp. NPDC023658 TaxID=3155465 RepID=UPI0033C083F9
MSTATDLGRRGEDAACRYLEHQGLSILARNWRCADGELDVVATDGARLVVVEVKCRSGTTRGTPLEAVTPEKLDRVRAAARRWLSAHRVGRVDVRYDVIAIEWPAAGRVRLHHRRGV